MCLGGGSSSAPPAPQPVAPAPPPVRKVTQVGATKAGSSDQTVAQNAATAVLAKKKGRSALRIPLISNLGTGINIPVQ